MHLRTATHVHLPYQRGMEHWEVHQLVDDEHVTRIAEICDYSLHLRAQSVKLLLIVTLGNPPAQRMCGNHPLSAIP